MLSGAHGEGTRFAMRLIVRVAEQFDAERLIDIRSAHVASAYLQGPANLDFAKRLADANTRVAVPTSLTACSLNLGDERSENDAAARQLIDLYVGMGCNPVMTCAPYHVVAEPAFGEHIAWCESSAVVYANSVLGARSNRYVEFVDMCAAVTGRVPDVGLHRTEHRAATLLYDVAGIPESWLEDEWFYHLLGIFIGRDAGNGLPAITGLPDDCRTEQLRALGAAAASSGAVSMVHAVGITPEAPTLEAAFHGMPPRREVHVNRQTITGAANRLGRERDAELSAVCVGAPHFSFEGFEALIELLSGRRVDAAVRFYAATSAAVVGRLESAGMLNTLMSGGVEFVVGRCTYYRPAMPGTRGHVMTNSGKWAYYAPSGLGCSVTFASLRECVESACAGRIKLLEEI